MPTRERVCTHGICIFQIISRKMLSGASLLCNGPIFPSSSSLLFFVLHPPHLLLHIARSFGVVLLVPFYKYMSAHRCRGIDPSISPTVSSLCSPCLERINQKVSPWQTEAIGKHPRAVPFKPFPLSRRCYSDSLISDYRRIPGYLLASITRLSRTEM